MTSGLLGHSSIGITADLCTHVAERVDQAAAVKLGALLGDDFGSAGDVTNP